MKTPVSPSPTAFSFCCCCCCCCCCCHLQNLMRTRHTTIYVTEKSAYLIVLRKITSLGAQIRRLTRDQTGKKKEVWGTPPVMVLAQETNRSQRQSRGLCQQKSPLPALSKKKKKAERKKKAKTKRHAQPMRCPD